MNVGLSVSVWQKGKSGVATYIRGLIEGLLSLDTDITLKIIGLDDDQVDFAPYLDRAEWIGVSEKYRSAVKNILWHQFALPALVKKHGLDLIHIPSYRRISANPGCAQIATIHDLAAFHVRGKYDFSRMIYGQYIVRYLARKADKILTVSEATAQDIEKFLGIPTTQTSVIWNGINHDLFHPSDKSLAREAISARYSLIQPYFIYLARLEHPAKNHIRLIEAFEQFARQNPGCSHDLVFGGADWHGADKIHERIAASPLKNRIRNLGFVPGKDLPLLYNAAEAMVYPSLFEGFGLPPAEAFACDCPVICSNRGSLKEIAEGPALLIDPEKPEEITQAMTKIALNPGNCLQEMIEKGRQRAALFDWKITAGKTYESYWAACRGYAKGGIANSTASV